MVSQKKLITKNVRSNHFSFNTIYFQQEKYKIIIQDKYLRDQKG